MLEEDAYGEIIWKGLAGYSQCVDEVLKGDKKDSIKKRQFYDVFLGIEYNKFYQIYGKSKVY